MAVEGVRQNPVPSYLFGGGVAATALGMTTASILYTPVGKRSFSAGLLQQASRHAADATDLAQLAKPIADAQKGMLTRTAGSIMGAWTVTSFGTPTKGALKVLDSAAASSTLEGARQVLADGASAATRSADKLANVRSIAKGIAWVGALAVVAALAMSMDASSGATSFGDDGPAWNPNPSGDDF